MPPVEIIGANAENGRIRQILGRVFNRVDRSQFTLEQTEAPGRVRLATTAKAFKELVSSSCPFEKARGYRFDGCNGPVVVTHDLFQVGRGKMHLLPVLIWDFKTALDEQARGPREWPWADLTLQPDPAEFEEWCRQSRHSSFIVHDIETPRSRKISEDSDEEDPSYQILRFSLARDDFKAISAPYQEPFVSMVKEIMGEPMPKVGWNSAQFDDLREKENGWPMKGKRIDAQWLWHFLQSTLPRSLGAVTAYYDLVPEWKSIGSAGEEEELYSCMDSRETAKCFVGIKKALEARTI